MAWVMGHGELQHQDSTTIEHRISTPASTPAHQHTTMGHCSVTCWTAYSYLVPAARYTTTRPLHVS
jgi:hypothetical protein